MDNIEYVFTLTMRDMLTSIIRIVQIFAKRNCYVRSLVIDDSSSKLDIRTNRVDRPEYIRNQLEKILDVQKVDIYRH